jgi:hypothetical protein
MNCKGFGRRRSLPIRGTLTAFALKYYGKPRKISIVIDGVPTEIRTEHFTNTNPDLHRYANLFLAQPIMYGPDAA